MRYPNAILFVILILSIVILSISLSHQFDQDEFEHIHTAWYIENGHSPYTDFFQHHHPLFWYVILPFLFFFGHTTKTLIALRLAMFVLTLGTAFATYLVAKAATDSKETGLLSALILLSMGFFIDKSIEIRPDNPQVFFGLISLYYLVRFFRAERDKYAVFSGLASAIAFLFLQKAVFLLLAYALVFCIQLIKRKMQFKSAVYFALSFSLPVFCYLGFHILSGSFDDYFLSNWILNWQQVFLFRPFDILRHSIWKDGLLWLLSIVALSYVLLNNKMKPELRLITLIGLLLFLSVFLVKTPFAQYFLSAIPLLCIAIAHFIKLAFDRFHVRSSLRFILATLLISRSVLFMMKLPDKTNSSQIAKVEFVLRHSNDSDTVYDGNCQFNLYRNDIHYFWFRVAQVGGLATYNRLTDNRYGNYDTCELIKLKKPVFISDVGLDLDKCGLTNMYEKTEFDGLYIRRENK